MAYRGTPQLPWLGLAAPVGAAGCAVASAFVLIRSDGQSIHDWTLQPTVYLAIASASANILLHYPLAEGVNVAWWRRSLKDGTTVNDLHRYWDYGNSFFSPNQRATAINGPLLQRASTATTRPVQGATYLSASIAPELPEGYTGIITGRGHTVALLTSTFTPVIREYTNRVDIDMSSTGCVGVCYSTLKGAGFAVNCSASTIPYTLDPLLEDGSINSAAINGTEVFTSNFTWSEKTPGDIMLMVTFKGSSACTGNLTIKTCLLQAATVEYSVVFHNDIVSLNDATTISDDKVNSISTVTPQNAQGPTTLGGMGLALNNKFNSKAYMRFTGAVGYDISSSGSPPNEYIVAAGNDSSRIGSSFSTCSLRWADPMADLLAAAREVMFRTAVRAANSTTPQQTVRATQMGVRTVYKSHYLFLALALLVTLLGVAFVGPIFSGWWMLGRKVSPSPIETAKAFSAPLLRGHDSNSEADALLKEVGNRKVKYGEVAILGGEVVPPDMYIPPDDSGVIRRLKMASPGFVRLPQDHTGYSG